jgi:hypothetical protein
MQDVCLSAVISIEESQVKPFFSSALLTFFCVYMVGCLADYEEAGGIKTLSAIHLLIIFFPAQVEVLTAPWTWSDMGRQRMDWMQEGEKNMTTSTIHPCTYNALYTQRPPLYVLH